MSAAPTAVEHSWRLGRRPALDGLRGVAIAMVVAFHLRPSALPGAKIGVDLFFVLSGFLITALLLQEHADNGEIKIGRFYGRRARRLLPALAVLIGVMALVYGVERSWSNFFDLGYVAGYVANYAWAAQHMPAPLVHTWSLAIEEQFYLVWPIALVALLRMRSRVAVTSAVALAVVAVMVHRVLGNGVHQSDITTDVRVDGLLVGCLLALLFTWFAASRLEWWIPAAIGLPIVVDEIVTGRDMRGYGFTLIAVVFACVLAAVLTAPGLQRVLSVAPLVFLGEISYALYLWHVPVIYWVDQQRWLDGTTVWVRGAIAVTISLALAVASRELVERRFRRPKRVTVADGLQPC